MARGAWLQTFDLLMTEDSDRLTNTVDGFARVWGYTRKQAIAALQELLTHQPCDILIENGNKKAHASRSVTDFHSLNGTRVTLVNRRRKRELTARKKATKRKRVQRDREKSQQCHTDVTPKKAAPSSSSSSSSSPLSKDKVGEKRGRPPKFLSEWQNQKDALTELITQADNKGDPESKKEARKLRNQRTKITKIIAAGGEEA